MKIVDILDPMMIIPELVARDKVGLIQEMASYIIQKIPERIGCTRDDIEEALLGRERLGSTGVGESVAIPHAKLSGLKTLTACFGRSLTGVPFDAIDEKPVRLVFVLLVPENSAGVHLKALARIARLLKNSSFRDRLLMLPDQKTLYEAFIEEDAKY